MANQCTNKKVSLVVFFVCAIILHAKAQNADVSGNVVSAADQQPLSGVTVQIQGTSMGTTTNVDGQYELSDVKEGDSLIFTFVGFETQKERVGTEREINVELKTSSSSLNQVVVVGYGTQKKENITGSVASIPSEVLENRPLPDVAEVLRGVSPNLNVDLGTHGGEPGAKSNLNIRGMGSLSGNDAPLILVDGIEMDIKDVDPGDIENISVLKDASASAIYGSRAPFGVILITTKTGNRNENVQIQYNNNIVFGKPLRLPHFENSLVWATAYNQASKNAGSASIYPEEQIERFKGFMEGTYEPEYNPDNPPSSVFEGRRLGNANYDWPHILFKDHKLNQRHNISMRGGSKRTQYYTSLSYFNQDGFYGFGHDDYERYNALVNLSAQATDWLKFNVNTKYTKTSTDYPIGITTVDRQYFGLSILQFGPMQPWYNPDGSVNNPLIRYLESSGREKTDRNSFIMSLGAEIEPVTGWKVNFSYNYDLTDINQEYTALPIPVDLGNGETGNIGKPNSAYRSMHSTSPYKMTNLTTSYEKNFNEHYFKILLGYEQEESSFSSLTGRKEDLISEAVPSISTALGSSTLEDAKSAWTTMGFFGRVNYNYEEKYLFEFSARYNGSSRFEKESRWGFFPSGSFGYQISKENFWNPIKPIINDLKLRASYGSLGNQNVANYLYISTVNVNSEAPWIINDERPPFAQIPNIINDELTWETIFMTNVGLDATFLDHRLSLTAEYFNRKTKDMFGPQATLPYTLGTGTPSANNASLKTTGFEVGLEWKDQVGSEFSYNVSLFMGDNKSKILKYRNETGLIDDWYEGKTSGEIWGYQTEGLIQTEGEKINDQSAIYPNWGPGDIKYKDQNEDGKITEGARTLDDHGDLVVIGNTTPRYNIGFLAGFEFKGIDFSMNWSGNLKQDYFPNLADQTFWGLTNGWASSAVLKDSWILDYWRPEDESNLLGSNTNAYFAKPYFSSENDKNRKTQSRFLLNAAFFRLRNIQLGYTIPASITKKIKMNKARVFVSGSNFIMLTSFPKTMDPEQTVAASKGPYKNGSFYPVEATLAFGINLTF